jgi:hypothetical protein
VFMRNLYPLPSDCRSVEQIIDAVSGYPLTQFTENELNQTAGPRTLVDDPTCFAPIEDSPEAWGNVVHQVELYPPPKYARGYTVSYVRAAYSFNGTNLAQSPLPFISSSVLLYGVRAEIAAWRGEMAQAQAYELKASQELQRLMLIEHSQRRAKGFIKMAPRFTRHRQIRAAREWASNNWGPGAGGPF